MGRAARDGAGIGDRIEFLPPRDFAFGAQSPADFAGIDPDDLPDPDDAEPRSRWLAVTAGLTLTALIAGGIVAAAPWDSPTAAPTPTTVPTLATIPGTVPATTDQRAQADPAVVGDGPTDIAPPAVSVTGLVFDPLPSGFAVRSAWSGPRDEVVSGWGEVYATPDATQTSGAWYSITLVNHHYPSLSPNATRVDLDGRVGLLEQEADGIMRLTASIGQTDSTQSLSITSSGRSFDQLVALFNSIGIDDDRPQLVDDRPKFTDPAQLEGFTLVASRATNRDLLETFLWGAIESSTYYSDGTGEQFISVDTSPRDSALEPLGRLAIGPVRIFPDATEVPSTFTGEGLVLGVSPSGSDPTITARWHSDDTTISVRSTMPLGELLELLPTLRPTTVDEWTVVRIRASESQSETGDDVLGPTVGRGIPVAGGSSSSDVGWSVTLHPPGWSVQVGGAMVMSDATMWPTLDVWASESISIATAFVPADSPARTMRVTAGGHDVDVRIWDLAEADPSSSFAGRVAVIAFEDTGPFRVELLDVDGVVLDHLDSSTLPTEGS